MFFRSQGGLIIPRIVSEKTSLLGGKYINVHLLFRIYESSIHFQDNCGTGTLSNMGLIVVILKINVNLL